MVGIFTKSVPELAIIWLPQVNSQVDTAEYYTDLLFLHFFILEFILRVVALGRQFWQVLGKCMENNL